MIPNCVLNRQLFRTFLSQNCQRGFSSSSILLNDRKTLYDDLDLEPTASSKDIKSAFIKLSKEFHPDKNPDDPEAASKFFEITNAYNTLGNPKLRRAYDRGQLGRVSSVADRDSAAHQFEGQSFVDGRANFQAKFKGKKGMRDDLDDYVKTSVSHSFLRTKMEKRMNMDAGPRTWGADTPRRVSPRQHSHRKAYGNDFSSSAHNSSSGGGGGGVLLFLFGPVFMYFIYKVAS